MTEPQSGGRKSDYDVPATATRFRVVNICATVGCARAFGTRLPTAIFLRGCAAGLSVLKPARLLYALPTHMGNIALFKTQNEGGNFMKQGRDHKSNCDEASQEESSHA